MKTAGGLIGIVAGVVSFSAALFILIINSYSIGWVSFVFPFLCIIFATFAIRAKSKIPGILLILSAVPGIFSGEVFIAFSMLMAVVGGVFTLYDDQKTDTATTPQQ